MAMSATVQPFLEDKVRTLVARARRLSTLTPERVGLRAQDRPFAPSPAHFEAANRRLHELDRHVAVRLAYLKRHWRISPPQRVLVYLALVERKIDRVRRAFGMFFEVFSQRGSAFAPALAAHDAIATDGYAAIRRAAPLIFRGSMLKPRRSAMGPLPPFQVTIDTKGWFCILDVRPALARQRQMLAPRLAEELRGCLVPRLWWILDNTAHYRLHPEDLLADPFADPATPTLDPQALTQWERARLDLGLRALRLYWAGDALHESFMPKDVDAQVIARFERFGIDLEERLLGTAPDLELALPLVGGALDAAALAAAMSRYRPLILTLAEPSGDPPAICRLLAAGGIDCRELSPMQSDPLRQELTPLLARSGALELCWTGLDLAVVHLVVPRAFLGDALADRTPDLKAVEDPVDDGNEDVWQDARVFCYGVP